MGRIIVVDTETTGISLRQGGRVIEIGAVAVENGGIVAELATLIDTGAPISYGAWRVHGISADQVAGKPTPEEVWPWFLEFAGTSPLVAHNAAFDRPLIRHELRLLGLTLSNPWRCTLQLTRRLLPHLPNHRLDTVYHYLFGPPPAGILRHRALDDARMTARIWRELMRGGEAR